VTSEVCLAHKASVTSRRHNAVSGESPPAPARTYWEILAVNQLTGPGLINFDMSLFKNMRFKRISETLNAQFRVEVFNIFNHPNFSPPVDNNALFDSTGARLAGAGAITSTVTTSRQIQLALKLIW